VFEVRREPSCLIYLGALSAASAVNGVLFSQFHVSSSLPVSSFRPPRLRLLPSHVAWAGVGVGIVSTWVPMMYWSECSPKWIRGAIAGLYRWGVTIGLLLAAVFNKNRPTDPIIPRIAFLSVSSLFGQQFWLVVDGRPA
jgi:hypothetical protein